MPELRHISGIEIVYASQPTYGDPVSIQSPHFFRVTQPTFRIEEVGIVSKYVSVVMRYPRTNAYFCLQYHVSQDRLEDGGVIVTYSLGKASPTYLGTAFGDYSSKWETSGCMCSEAFLKYCLKIGKLLCFCECRRSGESAGGIGFINFLA